MYTAALTLSNLSCRHAKNIVIPPLSLKILPSTLVVIEGSNGSGKTTLLNALAGLHDQVSGNFRMTGETDERSTDPILHVGHNNGLKANLTVKENLELFSVLAENQYLNRLKLLQQLDLFEIKDQLIKNCSKGQQKRTSLARIFIAKSPLWLLDEPFSSLDRTATDLLQNAIHNHLTEKGIVMISTHLKFSLPKIRCTRILL